MNKKLLITGVSGMLGFCLARNLSNNLKNNYDVYGTFNRNLVSIEGCAIYRVDLSQRSEVEMLLQEITPDIIVHCAALTNVDLCEENHELSDAVTVASTSYLQSYCKKNSKKLIYISTDAVYEGDSGNYSESDLPKPSNYYAQSKLKAEKIVRVLPDSLILRVNIFGISPPGHGTTLFEFFYSNLLQGKEIPGFTDVIFNPICIECLPGIISEGIDNSIAGVFNIGSLGQISKYDMGVEIADYFGFDRSLIKKSVSADFTFKAHRPTNTTMDIAKAQSRFTHRFKDIKTNIRSLSEKLQDKISGEENADKNWKQVYWR